MSMKRDRMESWFYGQFIDINNIIEDLEEEGENTEVEKSYKQALSDAANAYRRFKQEGKI